MSDARVCAVEAGASNLAARWRREKCMIPEHGAGTWDPQSVADCPDCIARMVLDGAEPIIRADERGRADATHMCSRVIEGFLTDLRTKIQSELCEDECASWASPRDLRRRRRACDCWKSKALELLDELGGEAGDYPRDSREAEAIDALLDGKADNPDYVHTHENCVWIKDEERYDCEVGR
jgi:hypothetical protein